MIAQDEAAAERDFRTFCREFSTSVVGVWKDTPILYDLFDPPGVPDIPEELMQKLGWDQCSTPDDLVLFNKRNGFTNSAVCQAALEEHRLQSIQARLFLAEQFQFSPALGSQGIIVQDLYQQYREWYEASNGNPNQCLSIIAFGKELRRHFPKVETKKLPLGSCGCV